MALSMLEKLTPGEFDAHLAAGTLRLAFVGMSNGGKSYRSKVLADEASFAWYQVDQAILDELGLKDTDEISAWLGYPYDERYAEHERQYLKLESRFTKNASQQAHGKNLVFDTTGSVVHLDQETLATLRDNTLVVHLDVGEESMSEMLGRFFAEPKPVAWAGFFDETAGVSREEALRHSYPKLLAERLARYRALAHLNIPAHELRDTTGMKTLARIKSYL